jgi:hypothetical protein
MSDYSTHEFSPSCDVLLFLISMGERRGILGLPTKANSWPESKRINSTNASQTE